MKKVILILTAIIFCLQITSLSQETRVGVTGGLSISNMRGTVGGVDQKKNSRTGLTFGMLVDVPVQDHFSFQPGLHYVQKGKEENQMSSGGKQTLATALRYAELQLNFLYKTNYTGTNEENFFIGAGPAFSINFPSKYVTETGGQKTETDITFGNEKENFRGFDFGANILGGFRFSNGFFISLNYTHGLRNLVPGGSGSDKIRNYCFGIRVGCLVKN
jgi:hypothetical protein